MIFSPIFVYFSIMNERINKEKIRFKLMPVQIILIGFFVLVLLGTLLLMLPVSSSEGKWTDPLTASFTAVSASCVTGLVAVDTGTYWSLFGQIIILIMIQIGGLGFMSFGLVLSMLIKGRITPRESTIMAQSLGFSSYGGFGEIAKRIVLGTLIFEGLGALALSIRFIPVFGLGEGIYKSVFHSVSAFCNAGFDIMGSYSGQFSSFTAFKSDPIVNITVGLLIIIGGIGFIVWEEIIHYRHSRGLSCYVKTVLWMTGISLFVGMAFTLFAEWNNPELNTFKDKLLASFFQSSSLRTAGMNTIDLDGLCDATKAVYSMLMFVGGSAGSTAGGVKTATMALLIISAFQISGGRKDVVIFKRSIEPQIIFNALCVFFIAIMAVFTSSVVISVLDNVDFLTALFETSSAYNTVGMTLGITTTLHAASKIILMLMMFCGRVGILTLTYSAHLRRAKKESAVKYPSGDFIIG